VGAGAVPPAVGFLADRYSFSVAFGAAGLVTLVSLLLLGCFPSRTASYRPTDARERPGER
jgi:fucose permease